MTKISHYTIDSKHSVNPNTKQISPTPAQSYHQPDAWTGHIAHL